MASLYEITGEFLQLMEMLDDPDVDPQIVEDTLEGLKGDLEAKAEGYINVIKEYEAAATTYKMEAQAFKAKQEHAENAAKRLKNALFAAMIATGHDDKAGLDTGLHKLKVVSNGGLAPLKIDIPPEELPEIFQKVEIKPDMEKIRGMLAKGKEVAKEYPWVHEEPRGRHLSIK